jgi:hypothetical protein
MEHWARPYQEVLEGEIQSRRAQDPLDPEIAEALRHRHALFWPRSLAGRIRFVRRPCR